MARGGTSVQVEGLREVRKALREAPKEVQKDARRRLAPIGARIIARAKQRMQRPYLKNPTGAAEKTYRSTPQPSGITLSAGSTAGAGSYVGWLEYGGVLKVSEAQRASGIRTEPIVRKRITTGRFLYPAIRELEPETTAAVEAAVDDTIAALDLDAGL